MKGATTPKLRPVTGKVASYNPAGQIVSLARSNPAYAFSATDNVNWVAVPVCTLH